MFNERRRKNEFKPNLNTDNVLVPIDGKSPSNHALDLVLKHLTFKKLNIAQIIEVPNRLPLDADLPAESKVGEQILQEAEATVAGFHIKANHVELLQARIAAEAIIDEAHELGVDAIVIGEKARDKGVLGSTTNRVLKEASGQLVIVVREPRETKKK